MKPKHMWILLALLIAIIVSESISFNPFKSFDPLQLIIGGIVAGIGSLIIIVLVMLRRATYQIF